MSDPLGLQRCASCHNAFAYDRQDDGTCRICGGDFDQSARDLARLSALSRVVV